MTWILGLAADIITIFQAVSAILRSLKKEKQAEVVEKVIKKLKAEKEPSIENIKLALKEELDEEETEEVMKIASKHADLFNLFKTYKDELWYSSISDHITKRYSGIENNIQETFRFVTPNTSNRYTHSPVFSSIIKNVGSTFGSTLKELINYSGKANQYKNNIHGYLKFLKYYTPDIDKRSVYFRFNHKNLLPFKKSNSDDPIPAWWHAYIKVKHEEVSDYKEGNLENALNAVASLAILGVMIATPLFPSTRLFANLGIAYPPDSIDISRDRLLFP